MIFHFLLTCTLLLVRSVWQWKLIFFLLWGDITMINFSMEWRKLEDWCNIRSEINLLWCEKNWGMWGINKYEITLSVFYSNTKRASFGKALLCQKCDRLWPSLGWKELGNEILSIYRPLFQNHQPSRVTGNCKINLEAKIKRKTCSLELFLFGFTLLILWICNRQVEVFNYLPATELMLVLCIRQVCWKTHKQKSPQCAAMTDSVWLQEFASIEPQTPLWSPTLVLGTKAWISIMV